MASSAEKKAIKYEKVSMNLTPRDIENIEFITNRLNARQQVISISRSLELTKELLELIDSSHKILIEDKNGHIQQLKFIL
jgi:hypothetical protein